MGKARYWNVWWTLTVISAALTIGVALLEALGVFRDLGIVVSVGALALTVLFGLTASTRSSLGEFRGEVIPRLDQTIALHERSLALHERTLALLDERLPRPAA